MFCGLYLATTFVLLISSTNGKPGSHHNVCTFLTAKIYVNCTWNIIYGLEEHVIKVCLVVHTLFNVQEI